MSGQRDSGYLARLLRRSRGVVEAAPAPRRPSPFENATDVASSAASPGAATPGMDVRAPAASTSPALGSDPRSDQEAAPRPRRTSRSLPTATAAETRRPEESAAGHNDPVDETATNHPATAAMPEQHSPQRALQDEPLHSQERAADAAVRPRSTVATDAVSEAARSGTGEPQRDSGRNQPGVLSEPGPAPVTPGRSWVATTPQPVAEHAPNLGPTPALDSAGDRVPQVSPGELAPGVEAGRSPQAPLSSSPQRAGEREPASAALRPALAAGNRGELAAAPGLPVQPGATAAPDRASAVAPTVRISIGRIEVQAVTQPAREPARARSTSRPRAPAMSLEDYLSKRGGRGG